jgi:hypothetical protein
LHYKKEGKARKELAVGRVNGKDTQPAKFVWEMLVGILTATQVVTQVAKRTAEQRAKGKEKWKTKANGKVVEI